MSRLVEIRTYALKPGRRAAFHALLSQQSVPLLAAAKIDVVAFGQSVTDADGYFLIRAFDDESHLRASQDTFYASAAWREGPRSAVIDCIASAANATFWLSRMAIKHIHQSHLEQNL